MATFLCTNSCIVCARFISISLQILHSICRIAEVLLTLQQVGNVKYTGWVLQVPCSTNRQIISTLQTQAKTMEDELHQWKDLVGSRRAQFYELNYFNTMQLLTLRRELGKIKDDVGIKVSPEVLALLHSISTQISPEEVSDAVGLTAAQLMSLDLPEVVENVSNLVEPSVIPETGTTGHLSKAVQSPKASFDRNLPTLVEKDLTEKQQEMMANISSRLNCSNQLVLMGIEKLQGIREIDQYDLQRWCVNNLKLDDSKDESEDESSDEDSDGRLSDSDASADEDQHFSYSASK